ncbi:Alkaline phosphatase synthesis sensor protein PhoR [Commensalibacter sp. Nvir]|uniref:sensor histidine kinase n=1 Tax=Commensalibacter sp. Nvir TaxID=3069817 RepID=UPI002D4E69BB|nr:Alkaline phosphatase synthesis sensor protein PhoR [Commensalibacter sp. Nvir]
MSYEFSFWRWSILVFASFVLLVFWYFSQKKTKILSKDHEKNVIDQENYYSSIYNELKHSIDLISSPVLLVSLPLNNLSLLTRQRIKNFFPLVFNTLAYDINSYAKKYYGDIILDILRHPSFFKTLESCGQTNDVELDLAFELPKTYNFKLNFKPIKAPHALTDLVVITIIDQSQFVALNKMRSDFISNASHELRTPLTSLNGFIQTLLTVDIKDSETQKKFLNIMQAQVYRMIRLTNDLLDLTRVERLDYKLITQQVDLKVLFPKVMDELKLRITEANIVLKYDEDTCRKGAIICADEDQLFQIFHNVLENAVRFAPLGQHKPATITCRLFYSQDDVVWPGEGWVVSIADSGPGIEKQHIPRLTERFYRADHKYGGTGLGLAIVKHLITRHKGNLHIESELGQGSCFAMWFPSVVTSNETLII